MLLVRMGQDFSFPVDNVGLESRCTAYDFQELIVGQYKKKSSEKSLSIEIYDMGNEKNSFGIYSAERFTDNSAFVAAESKQSFLHTQKLVAATAQNLLEKDGLADSILQSKNAGIYPNYMPAASS